MERERRPSSGIPEAEDAPASGARRAIQLKATGAAPATSDVPLGALGAKLDGVASRESPRSSAADEAFGLHLSGGRPLDAGVARGVEAATGADVAGARVHEGGAAAASAADLGARAFTRGSDIVLGAGERADDVALMAHEATHVAQQTAGPSVQAKSADVTPSGGAAEQQADEVARAVVAGDTRSVGPLVSVAAGTISRAEPAGTAPAPGPAATTSPAPGKVGGEAASKKIVRVAWTIDDGPGAGTDPMKGALGDIPATWYVQRFRVESDPQGYTKLKAAQDKGSEIAIHSVHPSKEHVAWFPPTYGNIDEALVHLGEFKSKLDAAGVRTKFTRLPGGLYDEIQKYLTARGFRAEVAPEAKRLIQSVTSEEGLREPSLEIWRAIQRFNAGLAKLGLAEWGGAAAGENPELQSWGAESSGIGGTDNVTGHVSEKSKGVTSALPSTWKDIFRQKCTAATETAPQSLVILTHDASQGAKEAQTPKNATEVTADLAAMEGTAAELHVRIEYYTMAQLYSFSGRGP